MSDLVKRLRRAKNAYPDLHDEAANRIEQLKARNADKQYRIEELEAELSEDSELHVTAADRIEELQRKYEALVEELNGCLDRWKKRQSRPWQPCAQPETLIKELRALLEDGDE